ncbi:hypothetical protein ACP3VU_00050 [Vibrio sp. PNB23_22_6]|uniref:hypothetical protein n=1 Tax=unclassified Vibrio TaxID=2614977 RepID=UPI000BFF8B8F|nr:hypothetical protein [Vibrio sp. PID17_43]PHJ42198.1 hypothetical protein AK965_06735 [Vibrio sp. PID17_43]
MRLYYSLTTLDPIILSQTTATTNNHQGLDCIPGSAILGMVAAQCYSELTPDQSWKMFHSSAVKYGPAYVAHDEQMTLPIPASWHFPKGEAVFTKQGGAQNLTHVLQACVENHAVLGERNETVQYKQCRTGYITANGKQGEVKQGRITKTALNRDTGAVADSQLFSYTYIEKDQTFIGWVTCETPELYDLLINALQGVHRIGRSRGSEFGRVEITLLSGQSASAPRASNQLTLWCLSDSQCFDEFGLPTLTPTLANVLADCGCEYHGSAMLNAQLSFIRSHTTTLFNQKRGGLDSEQWLISKGSVLVYDDATLTQTQLEALSSKGIGINQQQGLGWVAVNPTWAQQRKLNVSTLFDAHQFDLPQREQAIIKPATPETSRLIAWVSEQAKEQRGAQKIEDGVKRDLNTLFVAYKSARQYNRILNAHQAGPSSNQWRRVAELFRYDEQDWMKALFKGKSAICKEENDPLGWGLAWDNGQEFVTFAEQLNGLISHALIESRNDVATEQKVSVDVTQSRPDLNAKVMQLTKARMSLMIERLCRYDVSVFQDLNRFAKHNRFLAVEERTL